jgi:U3 small nucleolar RNA-associated protein 11
MSSLRNAVKRIAHKERSQPVSRQHLGLLEKKKDYKKRADDYHRKEDRIKAMKQKAAMRNPDEFYFGMHNAELQDGKHKAARFEQERQLDPEMVKLMKDQDLSYVRMQKQKDLKKAERMKASLQFVEETSEDAALSKKKKHIVFVDTKEDAEQFNVAEHFDTIPEIAGRAFNRPRKKQLREEALKRTQYGDEYDNGEEYQPTAEELAKQAKLERKAAKKIAKARASAYGELQARNQRAKTLEIAESHLVTEKLLAGKGRKRKIKEAEGGKPAQYKWRRKRLG